MKLKKPIVAIAMLSLMLLAAGCSPSAPRILDRGNDAFVQQAYEEALSEYQQAEARSPELAEPYYNAANTLYRQGDYAGALEQLQKALAVAQADAVADNAHFNAGNASFQSEDWQAAVDAYTQVLLRNPDDYDAKINLELALQKLQEQQQQDQQDQQDENQQNQDQQNQDSQQEQQDQSNQQDQQSQDQQDQGEQQDQESQDPQDQDQQDQSGQQDQQSQEGSQARPAAGWTRFPRRRANRAGAARGNAACPGPTHDRRPGPAVAGSRCALL